MQVNTGYCTDFKIEMVVKYEFIIIIIIMMMMK